MRTRGQADAEGPRVVGLKGDYDNCVGTAGHRLLPFTGGEWMGARWRLRRCARFSGNGQNDQITP